MSEGEVREGQGLTGLVERHAGELRRFLVARCGDMGDAEDILQDLRLKLASGAATGPIGNPRAYLFRMANNLVLDARRGRQRAMARDRAWLGEGGDSELRPDPAPPADERLSAAQEVDVLRRAIAALPPGARRALELFRFEERGQGEIARIMGISRSGVEKHLATAMRHLRQTLADCGMFEVAASDTVEGHAGERP